MILNVVLRRLVFDYEIGNVRADVVNANEELTCGSANIAIGRNELAGFHARACSINECIETRVSIGPEALVKVFIVGNVLLSLGID